MTEGEIPATHENWDLPPQNRWAFQNIDKILRVAPVARGSGPVCDLPVEPRDLAGVSVARPDGSRASLSEFWRETFTDGFLILHHGTIVAEGYFNAMTPATRHLSQSMAKSITSALAGIFIGRGLIDVAAALAETVPALAGTAYADATLRHVLDMRSGVRFGEDYTDPAAEVCQLDRTSGWKPRRDDAGPRTIREFIPTLTKARDHGGQYEYRSIETEIIAWACEVAGGDRLPVLYGREIWSKLGAEHDAQFTIDAEGTALADGGFCATLRDYGRFGLMHLNEGAFNGRQIVPREWVLACRTGDQVPFRQNGADLLAHYPRACYSNQWWVLDRDQGIAAARGANGQIIYVDPGADLVIVKLSSWPDFVDDGLSLYTYHMVQAVTQFLADG